MSLEFLLRTHLHRQAGQMSGSVEPSEMEIVETSLQNMANGGIYDQLGGAFHRYSVDAEWLVPHFAIILYDNALPNHADFHTYLVTGNPLYLRVILRTLGY